MSNTGIKMTRKLAWAAAAILALAPLEAEAATLAFSFDTQDGVFSGSGDLMVSDTLDSAGGYDVTGLSGTLSGPGGGAMTLVANPLQPATSTDSTGSWSYDNVVFASAPWFDLSGLLFEAGGYEYNLFASASDYILSSRNPAGSYNPGPSRRPADGRIHSGTRDLADDGRGLRRARFFGGRRASRGDRAAFAWIRRDARAGKGGPPRGGPFFAFSFVAAG